jgi:hypothetical protein
MWESVVLAATAGDLRTVQELGCGRWHSVCDAAELMCRKDAR